MSIKTFGIIIFVYQKKSKTMKKIIWVFSVALIAFSCSNDGAKTDATIQVQEGETRSRLSAGGESAEELKKAAEERRKEQEQREQERLANQTTMEISPSVFDFGTVTAGTPVTTQFVIKNTGDKPLIINDAKASCGCTVPKKPEEPIMPGEEYELDVTVTASEGQKGTTINKTVTVSGNIPSGSQTVNVRAQVRS